jgi:hypothetical protein
VKHDGGNWHAQHPGQQMMELFVQMSTVERGRGVGGPFIGRGTARQGGEEH